MFVGGTPFVPGETLGDSQIGENVHFCQGELAVDSDELVLYPVEHADDPVNGSIANDPRTVDCAKASLKKDLAKSLLKLQTTHKLPSSAISDIADEIAHLCEKNAQQSAIDISHVLNTENIEVNEIVREKIHEIPQLVLACQKLNSKAKLERFVETDFQQVKPIEIVLGLSDKGKDETMQYVPIKETLKYLLGFDDIFAEVLSGHVSEDESILRDFVDGSLYKNHPTFSQEKDAIIIILYIDEFTVTGQLSGRAKNYKITATYLILGNLPPELRSQLKSIQLVSLCKSAHVKKYGLKHVMSELLQDLQSLEADGIDIIKPDRGYHLSCSLLLVLGDNLGSHQIGSFFQCFVAHKPCRFCVITLEALRVGETASPRTISSHDEQAEMVLAHPALATAYGVTGQSVFLGIGNFHPTTSLPSDPAHDVYEGIGKTTLSLVIKHCIVKKYFTLDDCNEAIRLFPYEGNDRTNKPSQLCKSGADIQLKQTFCQMSVLLRLFPLMCGNKVPVDDNVWSLLLSLLRLMEYILSPVLHRGQIYMMKELVKEFTTFSLQICDRLLPKHHFITHYPQQFLQYGPLRNIWTMRCEAKHSYFVQSFKSSKCHKNVCKTMATKHQYSQCLTYSDKQFFDMI